MHNQTKRRGVQRKRLRLLGAHKVDWRFWWSITRGIPVGKPGEVGLLFAIFRSHCSSFHMRTWSLLYYACYPIAVIQVQRGQMKNETIDESRRWDGHGDKDCLERTNQTTLHCNLLLLYTKGNPKIAYEKYMAHLHDSSSVGSKDNDLSSVQRSRIMGSPMQSMYTFRGWGLNIYHFRISWITT